MKYIILLFAFIMSSLPGEAKNTVLVVNLSPELSTTEQVVYWFSLRGNEYGLLDSAVVEKGQNTILLNADLIKDDIYFLSWLTFSKLGPYELYIRAMCGEEMSVYIDEKTDFETNVNGCLASMEIFENTFEIRKINNKIKMFTDSAMNTSDALLLKQYSDSIDYYKQYRTIDLELILLSKTKSPINFHSGINVLEDYLSPERIDSLVVEMKRRFPDNLMVQSYPHGVFPKSSLRSESIHIKNLGILAKRTNKKVEDFLPVRDTVSKVVNVKKMNTGDVIPNLSYKSLSGSRVSLKEISTPYILLDFWASWCGPCRIKFPEMKKVLAANRDSLTVYAITLDTSEKAWQESIRYSHLEEFVNVMPKGAEADTVKAMFGIEVIPHNVLLDRERKIVATNIYGTDLIMKLKE